MATPLRLARRELQPGATRDRGVAGRNGRELADSQRPDAAAARDAVGSAGAGGAESAAEAGRGAAVRARAGRDVRRRPAGGGDRAADQAAAPDVRRAGARVHRAPRRRRPDRRAGDGPRRRGRGRRRRERAASGGRRRAVISAVPWFALPDLFDGDAAAAARRCSIARARDGVVADRDGEPVVRSADARRAVRRPARPRDAVGVRQAAVFGDDRRRTCRWCRAAPRRSSTLTNDELIARRTTSCSRRCRRAGRRRLLRATVIREPRATFSLAPGQPPRPATATARARPVSGRRLDRHRAARDDRERRARGTPRGGADLETTLTGGTVERRAHRARRESDRHLCGLRDLCVPRGDLPRRCPDDPSDPP